MKNFKLNNLVSFETKPFTRLTYDRYLSPIKEIIKRNHLPLREIEGFDNASMVRIDLEPTAFDVKLDKHIAAFGSLKSIHEKFYSKINGERISLYIPKLDLDRQILSLKSLLESEDYQDYISTEREIPFVLGETVENQVILDDLTRLPHLLIAGMTGSGKSVLVHSIIASLLYQLSPAELQFVMFDTKLVELALYDKLPHLAFPLCIEATDATKTLDLVLKEMQRRLHLMRHARTFSLARYNKIPNITKLPYLVIVIDEFADLIMSNKDTEKQIIAIAQKGRACGIHLIIATQRPDAEVVTGQIKSNIPATVALTAKNSINSKIILDEVGAENLNQKGDMLYKNSDRLIRLQGTFITEADIEYIVNAVCEKFGCNNFIEEEVPLEELEETAFTPLEYKPKILDGDTQDGKLVLLDEFYHTCTTVIERNKASKTFIRKLLSCGYQKAERYLERMKDLNLIGEYDKPTQSYPITVTIEDFTTHFISVGEANNA